MATTRAAGSGPIAFFTKAGTQISVPLSAISFDANDQIQVKSGIVTDTDDEKHLKDWLEHLVKQKRIVRATPPPGSPGPAMVVTAQVPGSDGDRITVKVETNTDQPEKVDVTVTETDVYEGLSLDRTSTSASFIGKVLGGKVLGEGAATATRASLVRVDQVPADAPLPSPGVVAVTPPADRTPPASDIPTWTIKGGDPAATSFILSARSAGSEGAGAKWTIEVADVDAATATFTLEVTWTRTVTVASAADLAALDGALGFAVKVAKPEGAAAFDKLPLPGTFTLRGGAERVEAKAASATVPAKA